MKSLKSYSNISQSRVETEKDLRAWGRYTRLAIYERHEPQCTLPRIIELGLVVPSGYYYYEPTMDPRIVHTQRVLAFMPNVARSALFLHYVSPGRQAFKARRLNMTPYKFGEMLEVAKRFYDRYRDTDFSMLTE